MEGRGNALVVGVVGPSGAGKTTLLERLIPALAGRGLSVAAVKHACHGFDADRPGKDSHRLYNSGATAVALVSRTQIATFARCGDADHRPRLARALAALPGEPEVVLVEGFSWEPVPRLIVVRGSEFPARQHLACGEVLKIVRVPDAPPGGKPAFSHALVASLASLIAARADTAALVPRVVRA